MSGPSTVALSHAHARAIAVQAHRRAAARARRNRKDMAGEQPMQRLVQGDVGSGKTMVAWLASLQRHRAWAASALDGAHGNPRRAALSQSAKIRRCAWESHRRCLRRQHRQRERKSLLERIANGDISFIVGTHALIQEEVRAPLMGLGVVDEQHRFGVMQRLSLQRLVDRSESESSPQPHMLLMSATPIPRSLAMVLYGDMEVSFVDELPPGTNSDSNESFQREGAEPSLRRRA